MAAGVREWAAPDQNSGPATGIGRRAVGRAGVAALGLWGALGASGVGAQSEVVDDELRIITLGLFAGLDPTHRTSASRLRAVGAAEGLLRITPQGAIEPELASSCEPLDPTAWEVALRPGVTFWSGKAVDAPAVVASLERARQNVPFAASLLAGVVIEPVDDLRLQLRADHPIPTLPTSLAGEWLVIHNAASYGPQENPFDVGAADLTGYFRVTAFEPGVRAAFERNPRYWGVAPRAARLRLDEITDVEARTLAALSGEAHVVRAVGQSSARQIERSRTMRLEAIPADSIWHAFLNVQRPQLRDARVRQALAWAVDRDEMVALAHDGWSVAAPSWLSTDPTYPEARKVGFVKPDPARAAALLDDAGWRLPSGGKVRTNDGVPLRFRLLWWGGVRSMAEVLQAQWGKIGAEVAVQGAPDYGFLVSKRAQDDWDAFLEGWGTFGDPAAVLRRHVAATGDLNYARLIDPVMDDLLAGFATRFDPEERRQQALKINERHAAIVPFIPLTQSLQLNAVSRKVRNYVPHFLPWVYEVHPDLWAST